VRGRLKVHLVERADFQRYQDPSLGMIGLFVPSIESSVGDRVIVEVIFQNGPRVLLHGIVKWRRAAGDARARVGIGVEFAASETAKLNYLHGYVRGGLLDVRERRRLPIRLKVAYTGAKGRRLNFTRDLNEEAAFVRTAEQLPMSSVVPLLIYPPGGDFRPLEVAGEVARQSDGNDRGVGVLFKFTDDAAREHWHRFIERLESDYLEGKLGDDALL
jgi:Tfp pilus assembly protein PilZ